MSRIGFKIRFTKTIIYRLMKTGVKDFGNKMKENRKDFLDKFFRKSDSEVPIKITTKKKYKKNKAAKITPELKQKMNNFLKIN